MAQTIFAIQTLVFLTSFLLTAECFQELTANQSKIQFNEDPGCVCTAIYDPVCASDGKTYGNPCNLYCARKGNPAVFGLCKGECPCCREPFYNEPIVSLDQVGFYGWNANTFGIHEKALETKETPQEKALTVDYCSRKFTVLGCACMEIYQPVCGSDGNTYGNSCELKCQQSANKCLKEACRGKCPCCPCPQLEVLGAKPATPARLNSTVFGK